MAAAPVFKVDEQFGKQTASDLEKSEVQSTDTGNHYDRHKTGVFAPLWAIMAKLDRYGVEARGIERVPASERHHVKLFDQITMWAAANCTISTFALGTLGNSIWFMGLRDAILTILFFNLVFAIPVAYLSTFGKSLGLRQMALGRYSFGYWIVYIPTILNLLACIGWSCINSIAGGQALRAVSDTNKIPMTAAIIVIAVITLIVSFFGYKVVHAYERYSWYPTAIILLILLGKNAKNMSSGAWGGSGTVEAANVLSFGSSIVGFVLGWSSLASDYTVNVPETTPSWKLFSYTYIGLILPLVLVESLGAAMMSCISPGNRYDTAYTEGSVGGLLGEGLIDPLGGFGRFLVVLLALSIVANNIPNIYSFAMTFQVLGPWAQAIPRPFLSLFATIVYTILACVGADSFETVLDTLLVFLSYWLATYCTIVIEEHLIFRKGRWANYDVDAYENWRVLPLGAAAFTAIGLGWTGAALGMAQPWYVSPLGKLIGLPQYGGDIGFELAFGFSAISYPIARYLEKKYWKH